MIRGAAMAVALAGLGISAYLTIIHYSGGTPICAIASGCDTVQKSSYASLAGVPVALLGAVGYLAIVATLARNGEGARTATAFLSLAGAGFSAWLTYVEIWVLEAICVWCVASAICMAALAGLSTLRMLEGPLRA